MDSGLQGPYRLAIDEIRRELEGQKPGVFALGYTDGNGKFRIDSIGRDDANIQHKLCSMVGSNIEFKYRTYEDLKAAFEKECELFHTFKPPGTFLHPDRPVGTNWTCPHCVNFSRLRQK